MLESFKSTWSTISEFAKSHLASTVDKAVEEVGGGGSGAAGPGGVGGGAGQFVMTELSSTQTEDDIDMGAINGGRRVDYVLQVWHYVLRDSVKCDSKGISDSWNQLDFCN